MMRRQPNLGATLREKHILPPFVLVSVALKLEWISGMLCFFKPASTNIQNTFIILVSLHGFWILISTLTLESVREKCIKGLGDMISGSRTTDVLEMAEPPGLQSENINSADAQLSEKETGVKQLIADWSRVSADVVKDLDEIQAMSSNQHQTATGQDDKIKQRIEKHIRIGSFEGVSSNAFDGGVAKY